METATTEALIERIFHLRRHEGIVLSGESLDFLEEINRTMGRMPLQRDGITRRFWFNISEQDKPHWYLISTINIDNQVFMQITDRDRNVCDISGHDRGDGDRKDMRWFLEPMLAFITEQTDYITNNFTEYQDFIEKNLPYRQRIGVIKRRDFNRIFPQFKLTPRDFGHAVEVLNTIANRNGSHMREKGDNIISIGTVNPVYIEESIEMVMDLYDAGLPFVFKDAGKILDILEERDEIILMTNVTARYDRLRMGTCVFTLPYEENCGGEDEISEKEYESIVSLARWMPEV